MDAYKALLSQALTRDIVVCYKLLAELQENQKRRKNSHDAEDSDFLLAILRASQLVVPRSGEQSRNSKREMFLQPRHLKLNKKNGSKTSQKR